MNFIKFHNPIQTSKLIPKNAQRRETISRYSMEYRHYLNVQLASLNVLNFNMDKHNNETQFELIIRNEACNLIGNRLLNDEKQPN